MSWVENLEQNFESYNCKGMVGDFSENVWRWRQEQEGQVADLEEK